MASTGFFGMVRRGACRGCKADIAFVAMRASGKLMPVNMPGERRVLVGDDGRAEVVTVYGLHFVTCPAADQFRQKRGGSDA